MLTSRGLQIYPHAPRIGKMGTFSLNLDFGWSCRMIFNNAVWMYVLVTPDRCPSNNIPRYFGNETLTTPLP